MDLQNYVDLSGDENFQNFLREHQDLIPDEMEDTVLMPKERYSDYPKEDFALITEGTRYFPLTSPAETVGSLLAFLYALDTDKVQDPDIVSKVAFWIKQAYNKYKMNPPEILMTIPDPEEAEDMLSNLDNVVENKEVEKEELPKLGPKDINERIEKNAYALKRDGEYYLPLGTPSNIVNSASVFEREYKRLDPKDRAEAAEHIKMAAIKHSISLDKYATLNRYAVRHINPFTVQALDARISASHDIGTKNAVKLIKQAAFNAKEAGKLKELADTLYELDKRASWRYHIDSFIPDAYRTFGFVKVANSDLPGESVITSYDLINLVDYYPDEVKEAISSDFKDPDQMLSVIKNDPRGAWGRYPQIRKALTDLFNKHKAEIKV